MKATLHRRQVVAKLLEARGDLLVVAGLGSTAWDCTAAGDSDRTFPLWGGMGLACMAGLGVALSQPARRVLVITGDGELLMGLGSLATIAVQTPRNLAIAVIDNERYGETGMQATHTASGVDLSAAAKACGFRHVRRIWSRSGLGAAIRVLRSGIGPVLIQIKVVAERLPLVLPPREGPVLKARFRRALLGSGADLE